MKLLIIKDNVVVNVVRAADDWADGDGEWTPPPGTEAVKDTGAGIGWLRVGGEILPPPEAPPPSYRDRRKAAYLDELGVTPGDFVETVGDVMDDLIREVRALSAAPATPEFAALTDKIDQIKARYPKA